MTISIPFIDLTRMHNDVNKVLQNKLDQVYSNNKPFEGVVTKETEEIISGITGRKFSFLVHSGTDALQLMLMAHNVQPGDEVICSNYSCPATVMPILVLGAKPIFIDIDRNGQQQVETITGSITNKTKAIVATGLYGDCVDYDKIPKHKITFLNDSAQSFLSTYKGKESSSFGETSILSFSSNKICPVFGTYGAVLTDSDDIAYKLRLMRKNGYEHRDKGIEYYGINSQPNEDRAAYVYASLQKLQEWQNKRKDIADYYDQEFSGAGIKTRLSPEHSVTNNHKYTIFVADKIDFRNRMLAQGIECQLHYTNNFNTVDFITNGHDKKFPGTDFFVKHAISIPNNPWLTKQENIKIVEKIKKTITKKDLEL